MKTSLILLLSCASFVFAQNPQTDPKPVKRLSSVTWDLDTHKLVWVVQRGTEVNGEFVAASTQRYEVTPDEAMMASKGETRGLGQDEASSVVDLVNLLSLYCAQSTDWWEQGATSEEVAEPKGEHKSDESTTPAAPNGTPASQKPTKVGAPEKKDAAPRLPGTLVAANLGPGK